jgi:hypothetical protein
VYPHIKWKSERLPFGYWNDTTNQRIFFDKAAKELGIVQLSDWNKVGVSQLKKIDGYGLILNHYNGSLKDGTILFINI